MNELKIEGLTYSVGSKELFNAIDFSIIENQKIGLIGVNGTGKTTFLDIISGNIKPDNGSLSKPGDFRVGYLKQDYYLDLEKTILETVFEGNTPLMRAVRHYEKILQQLSEDPLNEKIQSQFSKAEQQMNTEDAWNADANAKSILTRLGIYDMHAVVGDLSGGQQKRLALAQVLIQAPDLLILDEPTNHLDFQMIAWLEQFLASYKGALLIVTHDRYFLDAVTNHIVELVRGTIEQYSGNYQEYLRQKAEREEQREQTIHKNKQLYKQELAWMRSGVKARGTKQQARINRFEELKESANQSVDESSLNVNLPGSRLGKKVIELENASFKREDNIILDSFDLLIQNNERIGITGKNGSGKTTFLDVVTQHFPLDSGTLIIGETVKIAYYKQLNEGIDPNERVISYLREIAEEVALTDGTQVNVSQLLEQFLFPRSMHGASISSLSGGEKRRLYLLKLLMEQPNVLLLDEPTNDLDIQTLTVLEEYLEHFKGTVLAVSHDRYFLDKMADKLLVFQGKGNIKEYFGSMSEYLEKDRKEKEDSNKKQEKKNPQKKSSKSKDKTKLTYMEQKEWGTIEEEIFGLEEDLEDIQVLMNNAGSDYDKIEELNTKKEKVEKELEDKMTRWDYLSRYV